MRNPVAWLADQLLVLSMIPVFVMMLHVTADVISKLVLNDPIDATLEMVSYYYMVAIVLLPLAFVELNRFSIAVDVVFQMLPAAARVAATFFVLAASAACYGLLAIISWYAALRSFAQNEKILGPVDVLVWPARFLLPTTLMLTAAVCLLYAVVMVFSANAREKLIAVSAVDPDMGVD